MRSKEFLDALMRAMPNRGELEEYGLDEAEIEEIQRTFTFKLREHADGISQAHNELERMIVEYDCSTVEVGLVRFLAGPEKHPCGTIVAFCEADPIVVHPEGSVAMYDHDGPNAMECAPNSERFLAALAAFVEIRRNKLGWRGRIEEAAEVCAKSAGNPATRDFYRLLCGFIR